MATLARLSESVLPGRTLGTSRRTASRRSASGRLSITVWPRRAVGTVAINIAHIYYGARIIAPERDWRWLAAIKSRLAARAEPQDRFDRLVRRLAHPRPRHRAHGRRASSCRPRATSGVSSNIVTVYSLPSSATASCAGAASPRLR